MIHHSSSRIAKALGASRVIRRFRPRHVDSIADAMIRAVCGAEAEEMIRHKLTLAVSPSGERKPSRISHDAYFDVLFKRLAPYDRRWKLMLRSLWADEQAIILANLKKLKKAHLGKGVSDNIMYPQMPFKNRLSKETRKLVTAMLADLGQEKLDDLGLGKSIKDISIAFDVTNPHVKKWLEDYVFRFSENLETVNTQKLRAILDAGFEEGKSIPEMMKEVNGLFDTMNRYRAEIISRTESSRASNRSAIEAYKQSGVVKAKQWLTAPDCCDFCGDMDGMVMGLDEAFFEKGDVFESEEDTMTLDYEDVDGPPLHPNCVLPGTLCETPGGLIVGLRARYRGKAVELAFANGRCLSVTPNHMLLTPNGFAPAYLLRQGDDVFYCPDAQGIVTGDPNNDRKPTLIEEMVGSLSEPGGMTTRRVPLAPEYLHGDGRFCDGNIDIIGPNGLLTDAKKATRAQRSSTGSLNWADIDSPNLPSGGSFAEILIRAAHAADSIMGGLRQPSPFFLGRLVHAGEHSSATPSRDNPFAKKSHTDSTSTDFEIFSQEQFGFSGKIKTTQIVAINRFAYVGHVYDLQTMTSLYICNSILSSNCRCAVVPVVD